MAIKLEKMKAVIKVLSYPISAVFYLCFGFTLVVFHAIQWICFNLIGYQAHKKSVDILNWFLLRCSNLVGTTYKVDFEEKLPEEGPFLIVSNHQSLWDIPPIIWYLRKLHPKFVSKKTLGKGIPSISYNLRHGGSVLIDRSNSESALEKIKEFATYLKTTKRGGMIFPEGTRSRDGVPKPFKTKGLELLIKNLPEVKIVPVTINNAWKIQQWGNFPMYPGVRVKFFVHKTLRAADYEINELMALLENTIVSKVKV